jgi:hypothetical protein
MCLARLRIFGISPLSKYDLTRRAKQAHNVIVGQSILAMWSHISLKVWSLAAKCD